MFHVLFKIITFLLLVGGSGPGFCTKPFEEAQEGVICSKYSSNIEKCPAEIICYIANSLEGKNKQGKNDFADFAITCKDIYIPIINNSLLVAPEAEEQIINVLQNCHYEDLSTVAYKWSRVKKQILIKNLEGLSLNYTNHKYNFVVDKTGYSEKIYNFEMTLKFKILIFFLTDTAKVDPIIRELEEIKNQKLQAFFIGYNRSDKIRGIKYLNLLQGTAISRKLFKLFEEDDVRAKFSNIIPQILEQEEKFKFVHNFFAPIQPAFEAQVLKHIKGQQLS